MIKSNRDNLYDLLIKYINIIYILVYLLIISLLLFI